LLARRFDLLAWLCHVAPCLPPRTVGLARRGLTTCGLRRKLFVQNYGTISMPMERAVPLMLLIAASTEAAFRSGIFCFAISFTCFSVTLPTLSLFGTPEPLATPAALRRRSEAGGVLVTKVKLRSL